MSEYVDIKTEFKNQEALIAALMETGPWTREQIEVHPDGAPLIDYHGKTRPDVAHIIIRRKHVGTASNDIGCIRGADGKYMLCLSDFDTGNGEYTNRAQVARCNAAWQGRLKQNYAFHAIRLQQQQRGRTVTRQMIGGKMHVTVQGYR
jgi:hypothetical protein